MCLPCASLEFVNELRRLSCVFSNALFPLDPMSAAAAAVLLRRAVPPPPTPSLQQRPPTAPKQEHGIKISGAHESNVSYLLNLLNSSLFRRIT